MRTALNTPHAVVTPWFPLASAICKDAARSACVTRGGLEQPGSGYRVTQRQLTLAPKMHAASTPAATTKERSVTATASLVLLRLS